MSVIYTKSDSVGRAIVPAPLVSINKKYQSNNDGTKKGTTYSITLTGTLLPFRGSPSGSYPSLSQAFHTTGGSPPNETISGGNEDFNHILRKQEALRWLFSQDGGILEWQPQNGQPPVKCYPKIISITFQQGQWTDRCDYTIELEAPWIFINGTFDLEDTISEDLISSSNETWVFEEIDGRDRQQNRVTHEVNAQGKLAYDGNGDPYDGKIAWEHAKDFVDSRITGLISADEMIAVLGGTNKFIGNYNRVIKIDRDGGSYTATEEWLVSDDSSYEEKQFIVDYDKDNDAYAITYQGTIQGVFNGTTNGDDTNAFIATGNIPSVEEARQIALNFVGPLIDGNSIPLFLSKKTFSVDVPKGTTTFTFKWETNDNISVLISEDVQHSYSSDNILNTLTYTQSVEGRGESASIRLARAKNSVIHESAAKNDAMSSANTFEDYKLLSETHFFDKRKGSVKTSWTWTDKQNTIETIIQTESSVKVLAIIPIPGRTFGPIVQDMGTVTQTITTVTMRSRGNISQPNLNTGSVGVNGIITSDSTTWNSTTGVAERITRFLEDTG